MRIMITGAKGQLGLELERQLKSGMPECQLGLMERNNLDITDAKQVVETVRNTKPDMIINCAAYTNVDGCEDNEQEAFGVNALGARNLSAAAFDAGAKIIQVSTDYVFEGSVNTPLREYDEINPLSVYGKSKALGERLVRETNPRHFILRTAWLYGDGNNFVRTMLRLAREKASIEVVDDQYGTPTSCVDLAGCIISLMQTENYGTYHATCEGFCSWYQFARKIFEIEAIDATINRIDTKQSNRPAHRPGYSVLENFMLKLMGMNSFRSWETALEEYLKGDKK